MSHSKPPVPPSENKPKTSIWENCLHSVVETCLDPGKGWRSFTANMRDVKGGRVLVAIVGIAILVYLLLSWLHPTDAAKISSVYAPNGIAIGGDNGGNNTVINNGPPPLSVNWKVEPVAPSGNVNFPFEVDVELTPNVEWHPVSVAIICDRSIKGVNAVGVFFRPNFGIAAQGGGKIGYIYYENPSQAPNVPLRVQVFSDKAFNVSDVRLAQIEPPPSHAISQKH